MNHSIQNNKKSILWILSLWVFFFTGTEVFARKIATVKKIAGEVRVMRGSNSTKDRYSGYFVQKSEEVELSRQDKVITGKYGVALVRFYDGSTVWIDSSSVLQMKELKLALIQGQSYNIQVNMLVGRVRVQVPQVRGVNKKFQVHTPDGTASVRGTEKLITFDRNTGTRVHVLKGKVELSASLPGSLPGSVEESKTISANQEGSLGTSIQKQNAERIDFQFGSLESVQAPMNLEFQVESSKNSLLIYRKGKGGPIFIESPIGDTPQMILSDFPEYWNLNWWVSDIPKFYVLSKQEDKIQISVCHHLKRKSSCSFFAEFQKGESEYKTLQQRYMPQ